jgi:hypothetical protein
MACRQGDLMWYRPGADLVVVAHSEAASSWQWVGGFVVAGLCLVVARFAWTGGFWGVGYALFWLWIIVVCIRLIVRPDRWSNAAR